MLGKRLELIYQNFIRTYKKNRVQHRKYSNKDLTLLQKSHFIWFKYTYPDKGKFLK